MHVEVLIDVGDDGLFAAWVSTMPETLSRAGSKQQAERKAVALFMEALGRKFRENDLLIEQVFPLHVSLFDLDSLHCRCSTDFADPHIRAEHRRVVGPSGKAVHLECARPGCYCRGFASLWSWQEVAVP